MSIYNRFLCLFICCYVSACAPSEEKQIEESSAPAIANPAVVPDSVSEKTVSVRPFQTKDGGYGYDIYMDGKLYIHQPHIPAVPGNVSFKSEADAGRAAEFVANKIRKNIIPPSITVEELDSLGIK